MKKTRIPAAAAALFALVLLACSPAVEQGHYVSFSSPAELREYLRWTPDRPALLGAHRGGPMPGFPENCIATFENALAYAPCLIECDVRKTKEGELVMMHDNTLDRTTDGRGEVAHHTLGELAALKLKDNEGNATDHSVPTLADVLAWAKGRAIVELDIKAPVTPEEIVAAVAEAEAESFVIVITYDTERAVYYHRLNRELMISASARGTEGVRRLLASGIAPANLVAFVGVYEPPDSVYSMLHDAGIRAILGTLGNLDRRAKRLGVGVYREYLENGADILATDDVSLAARALAR